MSFSPSDNETLGANLINYTDDAIDAIASLLPGTGFYVFVAACLVMVVLAFWLLTSSDRKRSQFVDAWNAASLPERRALLNTLPEPVPNTWRETVNDLHDDLDCAELGVGVHELPRARARLEATRRGVPTHDKDNAEQIYERIRLTELREARRSAVHPLADQPEEAPA